MMQYCGALIHTFDKKYSYHISKINLTTSQQIAPLALHSR